MRFFVSPSGVVQVEEESFVPEFGKNLIVVPVHVACNVGSNTLQEYTERSFLMVKVLVLMRVADDVI